MSYIERLPSTLQIATSLNDYVDSLLIASDPCVLCECESCVTVSGLPYCVYHCKESYEVCKRSNPSNDKEVYVLIVTHSSMEWVYAGRRTECNNHSTRSIKKNEARMRIREAMAIVKSK